MLMEVVEENIVVVVYVVTMNVRVTPLWICKARQKQVKQNQVCSTGPGSKTMASYNSVKKVIINYIQKNYKNGHDISKRLK